MEPQRQLCQSSDAKRATRFPGRPLAGGKSAAAGYMATLRGDGSVQRSLAHPEGPGQRSRPGRGGSRGFLAPQTGEETPDDKFARIGPMRTVRSLQVPGQSQDDQDRSDQEQDYLK